MVFPEVDVDVNVDVDVDVEEKGEIVNPKLLLEPSLPVKDCPGLLFMT